MSDARLRPEQTAATLAAVVQGGYALARAEHPSSPSTRAVQGAFGLLGVTADDDTTGTGRRTA
ncbi:hypothetical protein [Streptomyces olivaceoviridis]|uniref:hypothetical protein n=1 Tax=Streptomyces olivaceoviridis TaxID=1921 RepID=UPI0036967981